MKLKFSKMHGLGNDFVVLDGVRQQIDLSPAQLRFLADRNFGVGCDQLLMVENTSTPDVDFRYRIFNADGGEVEHCGNGARCFVRFVSEKGLTSKREINVETASGIITLTLQDDGQVTVNMGAPRFDPAQIPFLAEQREPQYPLKLNASTISISALSMGNPHAVTLVDDVDTAKVAELGPQIEAHVQFPQRVNAGFMQVLNLHEIKLRVYERGSGETLACGTGASCTGSTTTRSSRARTSRAAKTATSPTGSTRARASTPSPAETVSTTRRTTSSRSTCEASS